MPNHRKALISLGSNENSPWGDAAETIQKAMLLLGKLSVETPILSQLYSTPAFPAGLGPDFVNACMVITTAQNAADLLSELHKIEAEARRTRDVRWAQRTLDIDLIAVGQEVYPSIEAQREWQDLPLSKQMQKAPDTLILPHPRVQDRAFVLVPMMEVAPDWRHPVRDQTIAEMLAFISVEDRAEVRPLDAQNTP